MDELITRRAPLARGTLDLERRTVDAVLSSGAPVERRDARGAFIERLRLDGITIPDRLPLLDNHQRGSIAHVLGHAEQIRLEGGEIRARLHLDDDRALRLIDSGAIGAVSIGYLPGAESWTSEGGTRVRDLTPDIREASLAVFPADPGAAILRSDPMETIENRGEINSAIRSLTRAAELPSAFADNLIDTGATVEAAQAAAFREMTTRTSLRPTYQTQGDEPAVLVTRMSEALASRLGASGGLSAEARPYAGLGLHDMCRTILSARGERVLSMSPEALLLRTIVTTDLPALLTGAGERSLMAAYQAAASAMKQISRQSTAQDFRAKTALRVGTTGLLERVAEAAEVRYGGVTETKETYALATFAKIWALSRQALVNDDLGAFGDMSGMAGRAAAETEAKILVDLLVANAGLGPIMDDTNPLFDVLHGNIAASGSKIDSASLAAGVLSMRVQRGISGEPINATPAYLLVSPAKEFEARQAMAAYFPPSASDTNPLAGSLTILVEPRLTGTRWYLWASPAVLPVLEYSYLSSAPGPQMLSREGFNILGMEFRTVLDFGAGVLDWRGAYMNPGA